MADIMGALGVTHRGFFTRKHLDPLIDGNLIRMTNPENPTAANQKYVLTEAGVSLKARWLTERKKPTKDESI